MQKRLLIVASLVLTTLVAHMDAGPRRRAVVRPPAAPVESVWLDAARETAAWLESLERRQDDRISWPSSDRMQFHAPGLGGGAAGIGLFYLRLYQVSGNPADLERAQGAANFVAAEYAAVRYRGFDWQSGLVGGGEFLVLLFRETGEPRYLEASRQVGESLLDLAIREGDELHWEFANYSNVFTGISHGTGGAVLFFLHLYEISGDPQYLQVAESGYRWMRRHIVQYGDDSIGWKRLTKDSHAYHGFCGGASGIIYLIELLHELTGKPLYESDHVATAEGLLKHARQTSGGVSWLYTSNGAGRPATVYCHGTACAITAMGHAWSETGDQRFLDVARAGAAHLATTARELDGDGPVWPHVERSVQIESGFQSGVASIGYAYLKLHRYDPRSSYLEQAEVIGSYLVRIADRPAPGQMRWRNFLRPPSSNAEIEYETGWYMGSAGIGLFFLELHDTVTGTVRPRPFSPMDP